MSTVTSPQTPTQDGKWSLVGVAVMDEAKAASGALSVCQSIVRSYHHLGSRWRLCVCVLCPSL